jgi:hypothetical protein
MNEKDYLDKKKAAQELADLREKLFNSLGTVFEELTMKNAHEITKALAPLVDGADKYEGAATVYSMVTIYAAMLVVTESAKEDLIDVLGGRPQGEAQLRYYTDYLTKTVLKLVRDGDISGLGFKEA